MSAKGQKRTFSNSFDHLVGASDQGVGDCDAECLGCSEIYNEFDLSCLLYRQIGRPIASENATGIDACQAVCFSNLRSVTYQASSSSEPVHLIDCGNSVLECQHGELLGSADEEGGRRDDYSTRPYLSGF